MKAAFVHPVKSPASKPPFVKIASVETVRQATAAKVRSENLVFIGWGASFESPNQSASVGIPTVTHESGCG